MKQSRTLREVLFAKVAFEPTTGCWLWYGSRSPRGYGDMTYRKEAKKAHRVSYELHVGPIPEGLCVCHRCDTPSCVNPDHLFVGTHGDNAADKVAKGRWRGSMGGHFAAKTHCPRGHAYDQANTYRYRGSRTCRACNRAAQKKVSRLNAAETTT
jgi:hypothetical protein